MHEFLYLSGIAFELVSILMSITYILSRRSWMILKPIGDSSFTLGSLMLTVSFAVFGPKVWWALIVFGVLFGTSVPYTVLTIQEYLRYRNR